jgi:hypothetical protein
MKTRTIALEGKNVNIKGISAIVVAAIATLALCSTPASAGKVTVMSTPTITCAGSTQVGINLQVCAGATGAPAGFSIQWLTAAQLAADGGVWPSSGDPTVLCDASFSGNANLSRYNLLPGQCVTVDVGDFLFDNGASTSCIQELLCGTNYVFRAFAHANSTLNRSAFTANQTCSTLACGNTGGCTLTQGYWKTHNDTVCAVDPTSPLCVAWPVTSMTLGTVTYSQADLLAIFNTPAAGNGLIALAHQLIAAKLNIAAGADGTAVAVAIASADALIGGLVVPPVGSGSLSPGLTSALITTLTSFNEGAIGPGHCG